MTKFVCSRCNYRFEAENAKRAKNCPYCGEDSAEQEKSAAELIDEVSDMLSE